MALDLNGFQDFVSRLHASYEPLKEEALQTGDFSKLEAWGQMAERAARVHDIAAGAPPQDQQVPGSQANAATQQQAPQGAPQGQPPQLPQQGTYKIPAFVGGQPQAQRQQPQPAPATGQTNTGQTPNKSDPVQSVLQALGGAQQQQPQQATLEFRPLGAILPGAPIFGVRQDQSMAGHPAEPKSQNQVFDAARKEALQILTNGGGATQGLASMLRGGNYQSGNQLPADAVNKLLSGSPQEARDVVSYYTNNPAHGLVAGVRLSDDDKRRLNDLVNVFTQGQVNASQEPFTGPKQEGAQLPYDADQAELERQGRYEDTAGLRIPTQEDTARRPDRPSGMFLPPTEPQVDEFGNRVRKELGDAPKQNFGQRLLQSLLYGPGRAAEMQANKESQYSAEKARIGHEMFGAKEQEKLMGQRLSGQKDIATIKAQNHQTLDKLQQAKFLMQLQTNEWKQHHANSLANLKYLEEQLVLKSKEETSFNKTPDQIEAESAPIRKAIEDQLAEMQSGPTGSQGNPR